MACLSPATAVTRVYPDPAPPGFENQVAGPGLTADSEAGIAAWKSAIATTSTLVETPQKTNQQAVQLAESHRGCDGCPTHRRAALGWREAVTPHAGCMPASVNNVMQRSPIDIGSAE